MPTPRPSPESEEGKRRKDAVPVVAINLASSPIVEPPRVSPPFGLPGERGFSRLTEYNEARVRHQHVAWVDQFGNGYTQPTRGHSHQIVDGLVQPADDGHTHDLKLPTNVTKPTSAADNYYLGSLEDQAPPQSKTS